MAARTGLCQETEALLQGLADGLLTAAERASLEAHLAECPACTAEAARLRDNAAFLQEVLGPMRLPADFATGFLFNLPRKDARRKAAAPAPEAPRSTVYGDTAPRRGSGLKWAVGLTLAAAGGAAAWLFFQSGEEPIRRTPTRTIPDVKPRPEPGQGPADPRKPGPAPARPQPPQVRSPAGAMPGTEPIRSAADLLEAFRASRGDRLGPVVQRGWELVAGNPAESKTARELAAKEKDPRVRAGLALCLGADGCEESRTALRGLLTDESPEVRAAAARALGRALSPEGPGNRTPVHGVAPLEIDVLVSSLPDEPGRADLLARLSVESDPSVRRILLQVLAPSAPTDPAIRARILEGVTGSYGDDMREVCLRALAGVQDPALVAAYKEALLQPGTPKTLHDALIEGMVGADAHAAAEALGELLGKAESPDLRRRLVLACSRAGGAASQKALLDVLAGDQDSTVRLAAAAVLAKFPAREVMDALHKAAENDTDQAVRQEAERVAGQIKAGLERAEGGQDNPPAPPPPAGGGN